MGVSNVCCERKMIHLSVQIDPAPVQLNIPNYIIFFLTETRFKPEKIRFKTIFGILKVNWTLANIDNLTK